MTTNAGQIADLLNGRIEGNPETVVTHPARIEEAGPQSLTFIAHPKYMEYLAATKAGVIIVPESLELEKPAGSTLIRVDDAYRAFARFLQWVADKRSAFSGIHPSAVIDGEAVLAEDVSVDAQAVISKGAVIGRGAKIGAGVYVGQDVEIGAETLLQPGVVVYHSCRIGRRCIIHANSVIGSDGFGFAPQEDGSYGKIPQLGNVEIADEVEIGANCCIDRATMGSTRIGKGVKIDNLVQVAHNVEIGEHTVIAAQAGISGSTKIGRYCRIGGQVGFTGHLRIADRCEVGAQSGVGKDIKTPGSRLNGSPAMDYYRSLRAGAVYRRLPELEEKIRNLEKIINSQAQDRKNE